MSLVQCPACDRHVRASESACPFCGAEHIPEAPSRRTVAGRVGRAAIFALGASMSLAACGETTMPPAPAYGTPPADAGPGDTDAGEMEEDAGTVAALYGGAPGP